MPTLDKDSKSPSGVAPVIALHRRTKYYGQGPVFLADLGRSYIVAMTHAHSPMVHAESIINSTCVFIGMKRTTKDAYTAREDPHYSPQISRQGEHLALHQHGQMAQRNIGPKRPQAAWTTRPPRR